MKGSRYEWYSIWHRADGTKVYCSIFQENILIITDILYNCKDTLAANQKDYSKDYKRSLSSLQTRKIIHHEATK